MNGNNDDTLTNDDVPDKRLDKEAANDDHEEANHLPRGYKWARMA